MLESSGRWVAYRVARIRRASHSSPPWVASTRSRRRRWRPTSAGGEVTHADWQIGRGQVSPRSSRRCVARMAPHKERHRSYCRRREMRRGQPRQESRTPVHNALPDLTGSIDAHVAFTAGAQLAICASRGAAGAQPEDLSVRRTASRRGHRVGPRHLSLHRVRAVDLDRLVVADLVRVAVPLLAG
jgi:hypothetical protein